VRLAYVAFDRAGAQVANAIDAPSEAEARESLRRQGLFVTELAPIEDGDASRGAHVTPRAWSLPGGRGRRLRQLTGFTRQLHVLVMSGTPLVQSLAALERQAADADWRDVLGGIRTRVEEGSSLSAAMQHHPKYFDPVCRSLIAAGESSGKLEEMLERLAKLTRKQLHVRNAIRGAMIYPCLLTVVAAVVFVVLMTFVLPRFAEMFGTLGAPLPPTTRFVMAAGDAFRACWWAALIGLLVAATGAALWLRTPAGRRAFDAAVLRLPVFGAILCNFATARVARLLGVQLEGRVPLLEALALTRQAAGNVVFAGLVERAEHAATKGQAISASFAESRLIPPTITEALRSGEATGQMATLLVSIADFLDEENDTTVRTLTTIIEPMILIVMGLCVGVVAVSMFLPLFDLTSIAGTGPG
jgi:type II secretory pathway component PulF